MVGGEVVRGDLNDRASLDAACRGASAAVSTASSTISRQEWEVRTVRACEQSLTPAIAAAYCAASVSTTFPKL